MPDDGGGGVLPHSLPFIRTSTPGSLFSLLPLLILNSVCKLPSISISVKDPILEKIRTERCESVKLAARLAARTLRD